MCESTDSRDGKDGSDALSPSRMDPAASPPPTRTDSLVVSSDDDGSGSGFKHQQCRQLLNSSVKVSGLREIDFWVSFLRLFLFTIEQLMRTHAKKSDLRKRLLYPHAKIRFSQIFGCVQAAQPYVKIDFGHVQKKKINFMVVILSLIVTI